MNRPIFSVINRPQIWFAFLMVATCPTLNAGETIDVEVGYQKGQQYRVQSRIEHTGTVVVDFKDKVLKAENLPIEVKARLDYFQRSVGSESRPQAVRLYDQSLAHIRLDKAETDSKLNASNRLIVTRIDTVKGNTYQIASVEDTLEQRELELLKNPADPLSYPELLTKSDIEIGAEWEPTRDALARFLSVDHIIQSSVKLKLKDADRESAKIYIIGRVKAEVDDALTELDVTGVLQVDRGSKIVSGLRLNLTEIRKPAQIAPGFEGKTKVDLQMVEDVGVKELTNESLKVIAESRSIRNQLRWESYDSSFSLKYDPAWRLIASADEAAVLRFVENGDLLAQCNIVRLASRPADKPLSLIDFETEVTKIIAKEPTSRVVGATQFSTSAGLKALRVTVQGVEEEVPLNWVYYNVASADGRQVTFVFTLEQEIANRVETAAKKMVDGFVFNQLQSKLKFDLQKKKPANRDAKAVSPSVR